MKKIGLIIFGALILFSSAYAREEELTITTYYPSPYGSYQQLYVAQTLGIGTTNPSVKLEVVAAATGVNTIVTRAGGASGASLSFMPSDGLGVPNSRIISSYGMFITSGTGSPLRLATNNSVIAMTIDSSQKVGIGMLSPAEKLEVAGNIKLSGTTNPYIDFNGSARIALTGADKLDFQGITSTNVCVMVGFPSPGACPANYYVSSYLAAASGEMVCCMVG